MTGKRIHFRRETETVEATISLGESLGRALVGELQIGLVGSLGAGKTQLVKGIAAGNAVDGDPSVTSPTFTLVHEYAGRLRLIHADLYRLEGPSALVALGYEEWIDNGSVVVIEWADRARSILGDDILWIELQVNGETRRSLQFEAYGEAAVACLDRLAAELH